MKGSPAQFPKAATTYHHKRRRLPELCRRNAPTGYWGSDTENTKYHTIIFNEMARHDTSLRHILWSLVFCKFRGSPKINLFGTAAKPPIQGPSLHWEATINLKPENFLKTPTSFCSFFFLKCTAANNGISVYRSYYSF